MTIVVIADENTIEQVRRQLAKLVPVVSVNDFKGSAYIERDLALLTVGVSRENRNEVIETVKLFRGKVVDVSRESVMVELAGTEEKIEAFIDLMKDYGIKELARTGVIAMARGAATARDAVASGGASTDAAGAKRVRSINAPAQASLPPS
jgi:acetolactate synthase-1/3 small subunit